MAGLKFRWKLGFDVIAMLLLVSCSAPPANGSDSGPESMEHDAVVDTYDATEAQDVVDSGDFRADLFEDVANAADADDTLEDGIEDVGDVTGDAASDVLVCGDVPKEGCPCDRVNDKPCCLMAGQGLSCEDTHEVNGVLIFEWGVFWDCGCMSGPPCEDDEFYGLCPGAF